MFLAIYPDRSYKNLCKLMSSIVRGKKFSENNENWTLLSILRSLSSNLIKEVTQKRMDSQIHYFCGKSVPDRKISLLLSSKKLLSKNKCGYGFEKKPEELSSADNLVRSREHPPHWHDNAHLAILTLPGSRGSAPFTPRSSVNDRQTFPHCHHNKPTITKSNPSRHFTP